MMMSKRKERRACIRVRICCIAAALILAALTAASDDSIPGNEVTDEELQQFGIALVSIQQIEVEANQQIETALDQSELSEERILEIMQIHQQSPQEVQDEVSSDELEEFHHTIEQIGAIHENAQFEMINAVEEAGFDIEEFNELAGLIQENPMLLQRLQMMFAQ